jgi:hypothetical protein
VSVRFEWRWQGDSARVVAYGAKPGQIAVFEVSGRLEVEQGFIEAGLRAFLAQRLWAAARR